MGTTLQNGVYLPNEGERNCYAGLKTNWEILDQKVADVTALQQAVAGALHREIVESLPTTDIDPNTIYMILSGTSATENVYNEFMYVNNAWELIGTSATDLTNYYTKGEVDSKLLLKASASDLTSHTGDTTIHVTASDKTKWNNGVSQAYVFRYSSTVLVASSTNSNTLLDNTDNLKVGDKVIDSSGVLFSITAIDTANSTFSVGTALIDLAKDSDVVHTSGNETVAGVKTFSDNPVIGSNNVNITVSNRQITANGSYSTPTGNSYSYIQLKAMVNYTDSSPSIDATVGLSVQENAYSDGNNRAFNPSSNNIIDLGLPGKRWANVYATNYYYGSSEVEFSTKFVTTDTNQNISGNKTFSSNTFIYNSNNTANTPNLYLKSSKIEISSQGNTSGDQNLTYLDKNNTAYAYIKGAIQSNGSAVKIRSIAKDSSDNSVINELQMLAYTNGNKAIFPSYSNEVDLGISSYKWKSFNGVEPSSLGMPANKADSIDISSYFTQMGSGVTNAYDVPANGYIYLQLVNIVTLHCFTFENSSTNVATYMQTFSRGNDGQLYVFFPVRKNDVFKCQWYTSTAVTVNKAMFIPCQGNV